MAKYVTTSSQKSKTVTLILCIFLGIIGAHHFYVGRIGRGFLYLFTGGLFIFGWILDIFKILSGTFVDGAKLPVNRSGKQKAADAEADQVKVNVTINKEDLQ